jgi:DNA-binding XRE family transcriptional regulator
VGHVTTSQPLLKPQQLQINYFCKQEKTHSIMKINIATQSIIDYRKENNYTQKQLALQAGITLKDLQKIEKGEKLSIHDKALNKLAVFLDED